MGVAIMARMPRHLLQALLLTLPGPAMAAPFCVTSEALPAQCIYYDAGLCQRDAARQGASGECVVNPKEVRLTPSVGAYCLVTSTLASLCVYQDLDSCSKAAAPQQAACMAAAARPGGTGIDPFALTRPGNAGLFGTEGPAGPTGAPPADALRNPGH
jgi:hypothetical protein